MKLWIEDRGQIETITSIPFLQFRQEHDPKTGEVLDPDQMTCDWGFFQLKQFSKTRLQVAGSLHKYWHGFNYGQFPFSEIKEATKHLCNTLDLDPANALIKNLEVGFNIHPIIEASKIIDDVICYKNTRPAWPYEKENEAFFFIEFASGDKFVKLYDKGKQFQIINTLRFETKHMRSRELNKQGATTLLDLTNETILASLGRKTLQDIDDVVFTDHTIEANRMKQKECRLFDVMQNPNAWVYRDIKTSTDYRREQEFKRIISLYGALKHGEQIKNLANETFELLAST